MRTETGAPSAAAHLFARAATRIAAFIMLCVLSAAASANSCTPATPRTDPGTGFTPFGAEEQVLVRGGNKGRAWELAVGTDTGSSQKVKGNLDWISGRVYRWKIVNSGTGSEVLEMRDSRNRVRRLTYPSDMDAGNALELRVSANASVGPKITIAASLKRLNGHAVSGSLSLSGTRRRSEQALYYYFPQMAQGFTAEGTVSLTYPRKLPSGSRVRFTVRAGTIPCSSPSNPPTVSISAPTANSAFTAPATIAVIADAQDSGTIAQVAFYANGIPIGTATSSPFAIQWTNVHTGSYSLTAVATDNDGLKTTSTAVPITVNAAQALYFIHVDHLNTPRLVADQTQKTVWRWEQQEPFGANLADEDPDGDSITFSFPHRFPGQYYNKETNLHYNYFRDYDPSLGRYAESDPIGLNGGLNTYNYVGGAPLIGEDPLGLAKFCCRPLNSFVGARPIGKRHCYVVGDNGTRYSLFPRTRAGVRVGLPQINAPEDPKDPRGSGAECFDCPALECDDQNSCLKTAFTSYPVGRYSEFGPNSNTFAARLALQCCEGGVPSGVHDAPGISSSPPSVTVPTK